MQANRACLHRWSGLAELLMVVNPLLVEELVAEVALNPLSGGVALPLVVGQTCLCQSLEGASRMVTVQSVL